MKKQIYKLYFLLSSLILSIAPYNATAQTFTHEGLKYNITDASTKTVEVIEYLNVTNKIIIPAHVEYSGETYSVTALGVECFADCSSLSSIIIPDGVTSLGRSCFANCSSLSSIIIPNGVTSLGEMCFYI